jgi:hypothetical protein
LSDLLKEQGAARSNPIRMIMLYKLAKGFADAAGAFRDVTS